MALVAVVVLGTVTFLAGKRYDSDLAVDHLVAVARPGDVIATRPGPVHDVARLRIGVERWDDAAVGGDARHRRTRRRSGPLPRR